MDKKIALYRDGVATFQTLSTTTASSQSTAIAADRIMIVTSAPHFIEFGTNPTATTSSFVLPADTPLQFHFVRGEKVAARSHSGTGHLTIVDLDL
jgi:hypothetical protein